MVVPVFSWQESSHGAESPGVRAAGGTREEPVQQSGSQRPSLHEYLQNAEEKGIPSFPVPCRQSGMQRGTRGTAAPLNQTALLLEMKNACQSELEKELKNAHLLIPLVQTKLELR